MTDRVTLQQAIAENDEMIDGLIQDRYHCSEEISFVNALKDVLHGRIVTPERAALETMAEQDCVQNVAGDPKTCCEYYQQSSDWCVPCWARHIINH